MDCRVIGQAPRGGIMSGQTRSPARKPSSSPISIASSWSASSAWESSFFLRDRPGIGSKSSCWEIVVREISRRYPSASSMPRGSEQRSLRGRAVLPRAKEHAYVETARRPEDGQRAGSVTARPSATRRRRISISQSNMAAWPGLQYPSLPNLWPEMPHRSNRAAMAVEFDAGDVGGQRLQKRRPLTVEGADCLTNSPTV